MAEHLTVQLKTDQAAEGHISGLAAAFGNQDRGGDIILSGAFTDSLRRLRAQGRILPMLWQHEAKEVIGLWQDLWESATGLQVAGRLIPQVTRAREAEALIAAGALNGLSIGYRIARGGAVLDRQSGRRYLKRLELVEISLVTFPMNEQARLHYPARKADILGALQDLRRATAHLRPVPFSLPLTTS